MARWMDILSDLHDEFNRYEEQYKLLRKIDIEIIKSTFNVQRIFESIITGAIDLLKMPKGQIEGELLMVKGNELEIVWSTSKNSIGKTVPINKSVTGWTILNQSSKNIPDVTKEPLYQAIFTNMKSELAVPLRTDDHIVGVINFESKKKFGFKDADQNLIDMLAGQGAIAIQNATMYRDLQSISEFQTTILREDKSLQEILKSIGEIARERVGADHCQILSIENNDLVIEYTTGMEEIKSRVKIDYSVSGKALKSKDGIIYIPYIKNENYYQEFLSGMKSELAVAVKIGEKPVGVINVESSKENAFDKNHINILEIFSDQMAIAISNYLNVNEKIKAQRSLANSMAMAAIGDEASNLIHMLNNSLAAIPILVQELEDLLEGRIEDKTIFKIISQISKKAEEALMVPQKLRCKYIQKDTISEIDVNKTIERVVQSLKPPRNIQVKKDLGQIPIVKTVNQIDNVIHNLLKNSYQAMPNGGTVKIKTSIWKDAPQWDDKKKTKIVEDKGVEIDVEDTGIGLTPDELVKITDPTYTRKLGEKGMGFGLWWTSTFLERIGGEFIPKSEKDSGAKMKIRIPLKTELTI